MDLIASCIGNFRNKSDLEIKSASVECLEVSFGYVGERENGVHNKGVILSERGRAEWK